MSTLVAAMDNYTQTKQGENGHVEYTWSNNIQEKIVQFNFQLVRTNDKYKLNQLSIILRDLLTSLKYDYENKTTNKIHAQKYLNILYKMIGHTRDIIDGKGECDLTYMMINVWYDFYPTLAFFAIDCLVQFKDSPQIHPYGSWKDLKYLCKYCKSQKRDICHPLIQHCIVLMNSQLKLDYDIYNTNLVSNDSNLKTSISLVSKWIPRENTSFGWIYESLATNYFSKYIFTAKQTSMDKAILKCKTDYRKILSVLNKYIDTVQIKQCEKTWASIDFNNVTSISIAKQKKAFLNITKNNNNIRYPYDNDRIECAQHFNDHITNVIKENKEVKGARVSMVDFTKQAIKIASTYSSNKNTKKIETELLNSQWRDNSKQTGVLGKMIAMVDVSGSMEGDPINVAIALGIRIAEKSLLGKRVMTFHSRPTWVNLEPYEGDFVAQVNHIRKAEWGMNTNFYLALNNILDVIVANKLSANEVENMILVILSDMQMDVGDTCNKNALYMTMLTKYAETGMKVCGKPYKPPHILFWNLKSTSGFPTLSSQPNISMMSGFSPSLLNLFCEQGLEALKTCTPWSLLEQNLNKERYNIMDGV